jgi:hypothetical protein
MSEFDSFGDEIKKSFAKKHHIIIHIIVVVVFAVIYWLISNLIKFTDDKHNEDKKKFKNIGDALYFSIVNHFTVGFGDISPISLIYRIVVCLQIILAFIFMNL